MLCYPHKVLISAPVTASLVPFALSTQQCPHSCCFLPRTLCASSCTMSGYSWMLGCPSSHPAFRLPVYESQVPPRGRWELAGTLELLSGGYDQEVGKMRHREEQRVTHGHTAYWARARSDCQSSEPLDSHLAHFGCWG